MDGAIRALESAGHKQLYLSITGNKYLLIAGHCSDQNGYNDFEVR